MRSKYYRASKYMRRLNRRLSMARRHFKRGSQRLRSRVR